jgi:hypothetical protein
MAERFHTVFAEGISVKVDLDIGHLRSVEIVRDGRKLTPFYTAPWVDEPSIANDESIFPNLRGLSGDFFCAAFGRNDVEEAPPHGWPANSRWDFVETSGHPAGGSIARFTLQKKVMGARLIKEIILRDGHPFVYQRHIFEGGERAVTVASHAMTKFATKGRLSFSPKAYGAAPPDPQESDPARGRSALAYPSRFTDLAKVPLKDGGTTDLCSYPIASRHEDFVMLVEAGGSSLGWAAAVRPDARDVVLSLKSPEDFPVTMLWFSNGGRDYPPWNGRNVGVLGIEEGRVYSAAGHAASIAPNPLSQSGIPTALELKRDGAVEVRHVIGGFPLPEGWTEVASVESSGTDGVVVRDVSGASQQFPFDESFLASRN